MQRVAELASLELSPAEAARMQKDLNAILLHIAELNEVDTSHVEPMSAGIPDLPDSAAGADSRGELRADVVRASLDREVVMAQAPESDGVYFKVPKVIER